MEDLLYFNSLQVSLDNVAEVAKRVGLSFSQGDRGNGELWLEVYPTNGKWLFDQTNLEEYDLEEDRAAVETYQPVAFLCVYYHLYHLCALTTFLRRVMECFGGWVYGADGVIHDASTVEAMKFVAWDGETLKDCSHEPNRQTAC